MISMSKPKCAGAGAMYFRDHLVAEPRPGTPEDYYSSSSTGKWIGPGAAALGLSNDVDAKDFASVLLGLDPRSGEGLVQGAGSEDRRAYRDVTFSAPKSVSSIWAVADADMRAAIEKAHDAAMRSALAYVQDEAIIGRRGKGGLEKEPVKMVAATFQHGTSREQDPQLHSHAVIANLGRRADGSWGAIDGMPMLRRQHAIGALYDAELAHQLQDLGFAIEREDRSFRVAGVPTDLIKEWSKRRQQIESVLAESGATSARAAEVAALDTRKKKENIPSNELQARWQQEAAEHRLLPETVRELAEQQQQERSAMPSVKALWLQLTERASTVTQAQIETAVFQSSMGSLSATEARQFVGEFLADDESVKLRAANGEPRYTSREMLELEHRIIDGSVARQAEHHAVSEKALQKALAAAPTLSDEQKEMVKHVTADAGVTAVQGAAGTGKSFSLGVARAAWEADGKNVIGAALAGKAAQGLEEGSGIKSQTIFSLLNEIEEGKRTLTSRDIIVVDEAGMVGSRQIDQLLTHAAEAQAKVVLVGDSRQLQPIDAGGSFRGITAAIGAAELKDIRRQKETWQRQAVQAFAAGDAGHALSEYRDRGLLHTADDHVGVITAMVEKWKENRDPDRPGESLLIAATRRDVAVLNATARSALAEKLTGPALVHQDHEYQRGDRVVFGRNNKALDVKNGSLGSIEAVDPGAHKITVKTDDGKSVVVDLTEYEHVSHGYAITAHRAQGVTVDHAFVLADDRMSGREWSYVAASRARLSTDIYADKDLVGELDQVMSRSQQKDLATDYELKPETDKSDSLKRETRKDLGSHQPAVHEKTHGISMEM